MSDMISITSLIKNHHDDDAIREAILSGTVKPVFYIAELHHPFRCYSEDGMETYTPGQDPSDDFDDSPYEFYQGFVYLTVNIQTGSLNCDFHLFTRKIETDSGMDPLPHYSLDNHLTLDEVMKDGRLTTLDAALVCGSTCNAPKEEAIQPQAENASAEQGLVMAPAVEAGHDAPAVEAPAMESKAKHRTLWDVVTPYILDVIRNGQYANGKQLFNGLEKKVGPESPFERGTGDNRSSLFVREISQTMALKTLQTRWPTLRDEAAKK